MSVDPGDKIIDSRDIVRRLKELAECREAAMELEDEDAGTFEGADGETYKETPDWDASVCEQWHALSEFAEEAEGCCSDWRGGATLIHEDYFEEYAEELAGDIGAINPTARWPLNHIDWESAAEELQQDYTAVEWDGHTYWTRS